MNELPDEKKTEQKKLFVVRNTPIRAVLGSLRRVCADPRRPAQTLGGSVRCTDAPPVRICNVYDIYELAEAENRARKASDGPEHGPGTCWPVALRKVLILKLAIVRARTEAQELARSCSWVEILST